MEERSCQAQRQGDQDKTSQDQQEQGLIRSRPVRATGVVVPVVMNASGSDRGHGITWGEGWCVAQGPEPACGLSAERPCLVAADPVSAPDAYRIRQRWSQASRVGVCGIAADVTDHAGAPCFRAQPNREAIASRPGPSVKLRFRRTDR